MDITAKLVEFAQKIYDEHLAISNVQVYPSTTTESLIVLLDQQGREDRYWIIHETNEMKDWYWIRNINV